MQPLMTAFAAAPATAIIPPHNLMLLDGPPSGYCNHPKRVGVRYICDTTFVAEAGLYQAPGDGCDDLFHESVFFI